VRTAEPGHRPGHPEILCNRVGGPARPRCYWLFVLIDVFWSELAGSIAIKPGEYARVERIDVRGESGLREEAGGVAGVTLYREADRAFSRGDRVQITAPNREQRIANRELGTVENIDTKGNLRLRLDSGSFVSFNIKENPHLDYGYAVTSHSSQGRPQSVWW
jgi:hypothetical protein